MIHYSVPANKWYSLVGQKKMTNHVIRGVKDDSVKGLGASEVYYLLFLLSLSMDELLALTQYSCR